MKIRDLNLGDYVIVYDIGKSEYSDGMTVVGKVIELEYNEDGKNTATILSVPLQRYTVTDDNYFDLWSNYIESKTEHIGNKKNKSVRWVDENTLETNLGHQIRIPDAMLEDTEFNLVGYVAGIINEMNKKDKSIFESGLGKTMPTFNYNQSNDVQQRKRSCGVIGNVRPEMIQPGECVIPLNNSERAQFIEQVVEGFDAVPAYNIGKAIEHIFKNDSEKAKESLKRAYENWD